MTATIDILLDETIGTVNPDLQGHFMEHLGGCIDGGIWVGPDSTIPNDDGIRLDIVEALRKIKAPVIRWPGGCFADDYHWRDGIGPRDQRPRRINMHWGDCIEHNGFGTHEFMRLCKSIGAKPYLAGNLGSGSPSEMRDWIEYCNFPRGSTLSDERIANGASEPFGVSCFGVGNENWGCGGNFSPEDYGTEYRRYSSYLRDWGGTKLFLVACGPSGNDAEWTRRFFTKLKKDFWDYPRIHGYAAHMYCYSESTSTDFTEEHWYAMLKNAAEIEGVVIDQRELMDQFDPERKIGLLVDEWGAWHRPEPGSEKSCLWQQSTIRDAIVAGLTLDVFNRHCDKVVMGNLAQTINVLQSLFITDGDKMILTPTYHVFDLYKDHQSGQSKRISVEAGAAPTGNPLLAGSASEKDGVLTLTITNISATDAVEATIRLAGGQTALIRGVAGISYPKGEIHSHNTFDERDVVGVASLPTPAMVGGELRFEVPPASVTKFTVALN